MRFSERLSQVTSSRPLGRSTCALLLVAASAVGFSTPSLAQTWPHSHSTPGPGRSTNSGGSPLTIVDAPAVNSDYNLEPPPSFTALHTAINHEKPNNPAKVEDAVEVDLVERVANLEKALAEANEKSKKQEQQEKETKE